MIYILRRSGNLSKKLIGYCMNRNIGLKWWYGKQFDRRAKAKKELAEWFAKRYDDLLLKILEDEEKKNNGGN